LLKPKERRVTNTKKKQERTKRAMETPHQGRLVMEEQSFECMSSTPLQGEFSSASQPWTSQEDMQLEELVKKLGAKNWSNIACVLSGRTGKQCRERWRNHLDPSISKQPFTAEEDQMIVALVEEMGTKWAKIAKSLPGRTDNSIKNRYYSSLLKRSHERRLNRFSTQEDALIITLVKRIGTKWSEVSKFLPGRTSKSIKNRYYSALKKTYPIGPNGMILGGPQGGGDVGMLDSVDCSPDNSCDSGEDDDDDGAFEENIRKQEDARGDRTNTGTRVRVCKTTPLLSVPEPTINPCHSLLSLNARNKQGCELSSEVRLPMGLAQRIQSSCLFGFSEPPKSKDMISRAFGTLTASLTGLSADFCDSDQDAAIFAARCLCDLRRERISC